MMRAVIIDDEEMARDVLRDKLEQYFNEAVDIVGEANDVDSGERTIRETRPDVVFLDIKMGRGTGFDLLQRFDEVNFEVIFTTAYDNFALQAFQFSAFDYLLKPVKIAELRRSFEQLEKRSNVTQRDNDKRVRVLIDNYGSEEKLKRLVISNVEGFKVVNVEDILRLEAERNYTHFILLNGQKLTVSKTIGHYEDLLTGHGFYRIHQSHMVNLRHVVAYHKEDGGKVEMSDGKELYISRTRKKGFTNRFI